VGGRGAVGAHDDLRGLDHLARELLERQIDDLDVVGGGVGASAAGRSIAASASWLSSRYASSA
jgi:hypothetical protein